MRRISQILPFSFLSAALGTVFASTELAAQTEIFLLKPQLHYVYSYRKYYRSNNVLDGDVIAVDSGKVEYVIRDSSIVNDSTVAWDVTQKSNLMHTFRGLGKDSLWWTGDSSQVPVTETITGLHSLAASGLIWAFPVTYTWGFCHFPNQPVFRYAPSDSLRTTIESSCGGSGGLFDTLWFSKASGYYSRFGNWHAIPGMTSIWGSISVVQLSLVLAVEPGLQIPTRFELRQNYPNPFNPTTTVRYVLPRRSRVTLTVYNTLGQQVATLVQGEEAAGVHEVQFDGSGLSSGVYFYRIFAGDYMATKKMVLLK